MALDDIPLGKVTDYPKSFSRDLLSPIPRAESRDKLAESIGQSPVFEGYDLWTLYELSWISTGGIPNAAVGEIRVPASSEFIVESKSLKLYINSLYYRRFDSASQVSDEIAQALTALLNAEVVVHLWPLSDFGLASADEQEFVNLDQLSSSSAQSQEASAQTLSGESLEGFSRNYKTDCFRSLCPVTGQPDWASIYIGIESVKPEERALASYLYSYSEHQGFHESCVEQIYADIQHRLTPIRLTVAARFTRRGGIDINPFRTSGKPLFQMPARTPRQ